MKNLWEKIIGKTFTRLFMPISLYADGDGAGGGDGDKGGGGGGDDDDAWHADIPEALRETALVKESKSKDKFWERIQNQQTFLGQSIRIPSENAGKEDIAAFHTKLMDKVPGLMVTPDMDNDEVMAEVYKKLGHPEKVEDYATPDIPEGMDGAPIEAFKPLAHKWKLNKKQFEGIVKDMTELNSSNAAGEILKAKETHQVLEAEWGATYKPRVEKITNFLKMTKAPEEVIKAMGEGYARPESVKWLETMSNKLMGEGKNFSNDDDNTPGIIPPAEAQARITEMLNNKKGPYWTVSDPGHAAAKLKMRELRLMANPKHGKTLVASHAGNMAG